LDLEGDLGIDTVKQVEVVTKVRQHFDLPRVTGAVMRDYNTLRKIIQSLSSQLDAAQIHAPSPSATLESAVERSGARPVDKPRERNSAVLTSPADRAVVRSADKPADAAPR